MGPSLRFAAASCCFWGLARSFWRDPACRRGGGRAQLGRRRSKPLVSSGSSIAVTPSGSRVIPDRGPYPNVSIAGVSGAEDETLASMGLPYWVLVKGGATVGLARGTSGLCNFGLGGAFLFVETE